MGENSFLRDTIMTNDLLNESDYLEVVYLHWKNYLEVLYLHQKSYLEVLFSIPGVPIEKNTFKEKVYYTKFF